MNGHADPQARRPFLPHRAIPLVILLLATALLSLLLRDFFRLVIFIPLLELVLFLHRLYRYLPQNLVWAALLGFAAAAALRALWRRRPASPPPPAPEQRPGRVADLATLAAKAERSEYARWQLAQTLEGLSVRLLEQQQGQTGETIRRRIAQDALDLPPALGALFHVCTAIPNYHSFNAARLANRRRAIPLLAELDLPAALQAMEELE